MSSINLVIQFIDVLIGSQKIVIETAKMRFYHAYLIMHFLLVRYSREKYCHLKVKNWHITTEDLIL